MKRSGYNATRSTNPARHQVLTQRRRDKYDNDWRFRIDENLRVRRTKALKARWKRRKRLTEED